MNLLNFTSWLLGFYTVYYIINIVYDIFFLKTGKTKNNTVQKVFSVKLEQDNVTDVEDLEVEEDSTFIEQGVDVTLENNGIPINELSKSSIFKNISFY